MSWHLLQIKREMGEKVHFASYREIRDTKNNAMTAFYEGNYQEFSACLDTLRQNLLGENEKVASNAFLYVLNEINPRFRNIIPEEYTSNPHFLATQITISENAFNTYRERVIIAALKTP